MAERSVIFDLIGRDHASKAFDSAGNSAEKMARKVDGANKRVATGTKDAERGANSLGMSMGPGLAGRLSVGTRALGVAGMALAAVTAGAVKASQALIKIGDEATPMAMGVAQARLMFGKDFAQMDKWASGLSDTLGMTRVEGLRLAGSFALQARQAGWTTRQAGNLSQRYVDLIQKVEMLSGGQFDQAQAAEAVASAFRGEYDSLQRVVPTISDAAIEQEALNIKKREGSRVTNDQARQLAVLDILQRGTVAGSALMETAEGKKAMAIANTRAKMREQKQEIEMALLPAVGALWQEIDARAVPALQRFGAWVSSPEGQHAIDQTAATIHNLASAFATTAGAAWNAASAVGSFLERQLGAMASVMGGGGVGDQASFANADHSDDAREARRAGRGKKPSGGGGGGIKIPVIPSGRALGGAGGGGGTSDIVNMMIRIGGAGAQGLAFGIRGKASVIQDAIQKVMDKAKDTYQKQLDKLNDLKGKRSDLANSVADGIRAAGGSAITGRGGGGLLGRLGQAARNAGSFYGALKKLRAMKVSPALLQQIAEAGPVDGLQAAREIIAAGNAHDFNKQQLMIDRYGALAGSMAGDSVYGAAIKKQQGVTDAAKRQIFGATIIDNRVNITIPKGYVGTAKDLAALIKDALKQSGNAGQRVKLT